MLGKFGNNHSEVKSKLYSRCHDEHCKVWSTYMEQGFDSDRNVRQVIETDNRLVTLNNLVDSVFPDDFLTSSSYTVFAPTDNAFGMVDPKLIAKLRKDQKQLKSVLALHVIEGLVLDANQIKFLTEGEQVTTLASNGGINNKLSFAVVRGKVFVSTGSTSAEVVETVYARNGIVHLINRVLM